MGRSIRLSSFWKEKSLWKHGGRFDGAIYHCIKAYFQKNYGDVWEENEARMG